MEVRDFLVTGERFSVVRDEEKGYLKTLPQPSADKMHIYYQSENYISHTDSSEDWFSRLYQIIKRWSLRRKIKLINSFIKFPATLLDVGAGTGDFLLQARHYGWNIKGVEPNVQARNLSEKKGILLSSSLEEVTGQQFDVVTLWHVLEHIPNLEETVHQLSHLVKPGGILIIAVPNYKSYDARFYKEFWAAYDVPRHLWHFCKQSLQAQFSLHFTLERIKPMWFDSFYVSLLSEKYKSGKKFSLKALGIGAISNLAGLFSKEYSSQIYCFRRNSP